MDRKFDIQKEIDPNDPYGVTDSTVLLYDIAESLQRVVDQLDIIIDKVHNDS